MVAYEGAATVPIAQYLIWRKYIPLKLKFLCEYVIQKVAELRYPVN